MHVILNKVDSWRSRNKTTRINRIEKEIGTFKHAFKCVLYRASKKLTGRMKGEVSVEDCVAVPTTSEKR